LCCIKCTGGVVLCCIKCTGGVVLCCIKCTGEGVVLYKVYRRCCVV